MLPLWVRVDLGAMAMKGYFAFPKAPELLYVNKTELFELELFELLEIEMFLAITLCTYAKLNCLK